MVNDDKKERINGVFSSQEVKRIGTGTTTRKTIQKSLWFCNELDDGQIEIQPINMNYVPSGAKKTISSDAFLATFSPEPEVYVAQVFPKMRELTQTVARADRFRKNGETFTAEVEYGKALKVDEENVRANFGLGLTYLERGDTKKAENIFERLVKLEAAFEKEHKHLFNEFGISLRKTGLVDQSIQYYTKALELASEDENLYYNIARAYFDKKDMVSTVKYLLDSLQQKGGFEISLKFLAWLLEKQLIPPSLEEQVGEALKNANLAQSAAASEDGVAAPAGSASS